MDKIKCLVCGNEFIPTKEGHYVCRDDVTQGGIGTAMVWNKESTLWDCWDCPVCGAQLIRGKQRFRKYDSRVDEIMEVKNMGLTKEQAIEGHRKMWNWIAEQYRAGETVLEELGHTCVVDLKYSYINRFCNEPIMNGCFCCAYASEEFDRTINGCTCDFCPIDWGSEVKAFMCIDRYEEDDEEGIYNELQATSTYSHDYDRMAELAEEIANLPEREV